MARRSDIFQLSQLLKCGKSFVQPLVEAKFQISRSRIVNQLGRDPLKIFYVNPAS
jgi:hypothetical protein